MNPWLIFAILAAFFSTAYTLYARKALKKESDYVAFTVVLDLTACITLIIISLIWGFRFINAWKPLLILGGISIIGAVVDLLFVKGRQLEDASTIPVILQTSTLWTLFGAALFLAEPLTLLKSAGILLIISGNLVRSYSGKRITLSNGVKQLLLASFLYSIIILVNKYLLHYYSPALLQAILFFCGAIWILIYLRFDLRRVSVKLREKGQVITLSGILLALTLMFFYKGLEIGEASRVMPVYQLNIILSAIFGIFILKEKDNLWKKILAAVLVFAGIILISI